METNNNHIKGIWVTFRIDYVAAGRRHFAILCGNMEDARAAAADVNSIDGVCNIRFNKCGRLPKGTVVSIYNPKHENYYIQP